jgi:hypothetical protein
LPLCCRFLATRGDLEHALAVRDLE